MSSGQFTERSKSGDLLLFRGFEFPAKCQRYFTTSHYDHVALLVKRYYELEVYETTSAQVYFWVFCHTIFFILLKFYLFLNNFRAAKYYLGDFS